jgi:ubiquinone/menaquinone biosynthesis C-methylase UbiE
MSERIPLEREAIAEADAVEQYDKGARLYMQPEYKYFVWKVLRKRPKSGRVLDIGTGSGRLAIELARTRGTNFEITGLDVSENMLKKAAENASQAGVSEKLKLVKGNADNMPFPNDYFDLVISYASLHHWARPAMVLNEARRVVKASGTVIIRDNRRVYGNPFWEMFIWILTRFMNKRHRDNWPHAIYASYTIPEVRGILEKAGLKEYKVSADFIRFDLCAEMIKNGE